MDASYFDQNTDLASPKSEVCKFDIVKPKTVPTDLSKWSNRVDNNVVKKTVYDGLVKRRNAINSEKQNLEKRTLIKRYLISVNILRPKTWIDQQKQMLMQ